MRILANSKFGGRWECDINESDGNRYRVLHNVTSDGRSTWHDSDQEEDLQWLMDFNGLIEVNIVEKD